MPKKTPELNGQGIPRRKRGQGRLFQQPGCANWFYSFYDDAGRRRTASTHTPNLQKAEQALALAMEKDRQGLLESPCASRVTVDELMQDSFDDYTLIKKKTKSLDQMQRRWRLHLKAHFGGFRAIRLRHDHMVAYTKARLAEGDQPGSVNLELGQLRHALLLGVENNKLGKMPTKVKLMHVENRKKDYIGVLDYDRVADVFAKRGGLYMRCLLEIAVTCGWRMKNEILSLPVSAFNPVTGTLRTETSKNGEPNEIALLEPARGMIAELCRGKKGHHPIFTRPGAPTKFIGNLYFHWKTLMAEAGLAKWHCPYCQSDVRRIPFPGKTTNKYFCDACDRRIGRRQLRFDGPLPHSLRRTFATNIINAGGSETLGMQVGNWKTASIFRTYSIKSTEGSRRAAELLAEYREAMKFKAEQEAARAMNDAVNSHITAPPALLN